VELKECEPQPDGHPIVAEIVSVQPKKNPAEAELRTAQGNVNALRA
jgi:hypothetical protein